MHFQHNSNWISVLKASKLVETSSYKQQGNIQKAVWSIVRNTYDIHLKGNTLNANQLESSG